jgi:hypothetical protein
MLTKALELAVVPPFGLCFKLMLEPGPMIEPLREGARRPT